VQRRAETHLGHAWLPAVLPAGACRLFVSDPALAEVLRDAGAEIVEQGADVEIGPPAELVGDAAFAMSPIGEPSADVRSFATRAAGRLGGAALVRVRAVRVARTLRRAGYPETELFAWDPGHRLPLGMRTRPSLAERVPRRVVVVGRRGPRQPTLLEAAIEDAAAEVQRPLRLEWASPRAGPTTVALDDGLMRVAVGPARGQLERQAAAHATLRQARLPGQMSELIPWLEARGRTGLADWSLERLMRGTRPAAPLSKQLLAGCVEFLVALHGADGVAETISTAETAAAFCPPPEAGAIVSLGERLEARLADLPRGFAHGDFFPGNLLVEDSRLVGVVDWDASGPGRLPLLDLLHLRHMSDRRPSDLDWGPTLVEHLLPWAQRGSDAATREYCRRVGVEPLPDTLVALVAAYWLDRLAYQLATYADRAARRRWIERNVAFVLRTLAAESLV
jgi:Phosphotransferase enzyme family